jgi:23S rRNA (adenine(2503)-C(2))-methyltransferase
MKIEDLKKIISDIGQPSYRFKQIKKAIFSEGIISFLDITNLPMDLRDSLEERVRILPFEVEETVVSRDGRAIKSVLSLPDKQLIETVLISPKPGSWSACISSQVGCALGCLFCATGQGGFKRDLSAEEIVGQVLFWKNYLKGRGQKLNDIVYMGMGEPFLNWNNVKNSLKVITDKDCIGFSRRSISISTAGIPAGIKDLAKNFPQVNLALSLHFADNQIRSGFMPINKKYSLDLLRDTLKEYFKQVRRRVFIEYILLSGVNDRKEDAKKLAEYLISINEPALTHVNLIQYNPIGTNLSCSSRETALNFLGQLRKYHISCTIRKNLGEDIQGACGQLAGKKEIDR